MSKIFEAQEILIMRTATAGTPAEAMEWITVYEALSRLPVGLAADTSELKTSPERCASKMRYPTFADAQHFATVYSQAAYQCNNCGYFHLTSRRQAPVVLRTPVEAQSPTNGYSVSQMKPKTEQGGF
jgi:hypothetical protein